MHNPCFDCWNRYGHQYTKDCDKKCGYADAIKDIKWLISNWFSALEDEGCDPWKYDKCIHMSDKYRYTREDYKEYLKTVY